jgi:hypothetical protein
MMQVPKAEKVEVLEQQSGAVVHLLCAFTIK